MIINANASGGSPELQDKTVTPTPSGVTVTPDDGYEALGKVDVVGSSGLVASNIRSGVTIFGIVGTGEMPVRTITLTPKERYIFGTSPNTSSHGDIGSTVNKTVYYPNTNLNIASDGTNITPSGTGLTFKTVKLGAFISIYQLSYTSVQEDHGLADKLKYICPSGKTFTATITGRLVVSQYVIDDTDVTKTMFGGEVQASFTINASGTSTSCTYSIPTQPKTYTDWSQWLSTAPQAGTYGPALMIDTITYTLS